MIGPIAIIGGTGTLGRSIVKTILADRTNSSILIFSRDGIMPGELNEKLINVHSNESKAISSQEVKLLLS